MLAQRSGSQPAGGAVQQQQPEGGPCVAGLPDVRCGRKSKEGTEEVGRMVTHTSTTATTSQGVRWKLASRAQAFTESTACTCAGERVRLSEKAA